ncbi:hypothetical protein Geob_0930 [Geotalea daltonii FRC-32]|uniref:Uncharacterized protein n=1 Tax=Geotalea daltonii (strain DSM 22248 / JCM 15807 / FRC-32) TaxID=316067 RepID=B9M1Z6_GEODF|nr:hypothetical protein [Geotalea daltonii]ACM19292.1 hypothetical protein Geob_0930 [Geotalea daltonii FRC-32]
MNTEIIDEAIEKYVHERMTAGRKRATERFLSYAYLKQGKDGVSEFLQKVRGLSNYYIDFLRVMSNPFKGPELAWLASMITIAVYAVILMGFEEDRTVGIFLFAGTLVNGWSLIRTIARKWCDIGVMIAIYLEIAQLAEHELEQMN